MTVLIVEDSYPAYLACRAQLGHYGFNHELAKDGNEGRQMLIESGREYEFVLMDIGLPFTNGIDLTREARAAGIKTGIFALTANLRDYKKEDLIAAGMNLVFEKPFQVYDFAKICKELRIRPKQNVKKFISKIDPLDEKNLLNFYMADFEPKMAVPRREWTSAFNKYLDQLKKGLEDNNDKSVQHAVLELHGCAIYINSVRLFLVTLWLHELIRNNDSMIGSDEFQFYYDMFYESMRCYAESLKTELI